MNDVSQSGRSRELIKQEYDMPSLRAGFVALLIFSRASVAVPVVLSRSTSSPLTALLSFVSAKGGSEDIVRGSIGVRRRMSMSLGGRLTGIHEVRHRANGCV
jgi:hypothetical protein